MQEIDEQEEGEFAARSWLAERIQNTPWWAISVAFHALVLACLGLVTFQKELLGRPDKPTIVTLPSKPRESAVPLDVKRGASDRSGPPSSDPAPDMSKDTVPIFAPELEEGDWNETANNDPSREMLRT